MLGYVSVKLSKLDLYYMSEHFDKARACNTDARNFRAMLRLNAVTTNGLITVNDDLAFSLKGIRKYIVMQQRKMSFLDRLFFKLQLNGAI